jgi:hypothetical protein
VCELAAWRLRSARTSSSAIAPRLAPELAAGVQVGEDLELAARVFAAGVRAAAATSGAEGGPYTVNSRRRGAAARLSLEVVDWYPTSGGPRE